MSHTIQRSSDIDQAIAEIEQIHQSRKFRAGVISTVMRFHPNHPVEARTFVEVLSAQLGLLESVDKESSPTKKRRVEWILIEAAVIDERAVFTLCGIDRKELARIKKAMPKKKSKGATP